MGTTQLYVELILIGMESFAWIVIFLADIVGEKVFAVSLDMLRNFGSSVLMIGLLYILGLFCDRLADMLLWRTEKKIRKKSGMDSETSILIWETHNLDGFVNYMRSRIRILRASILNLPMITVSLHVYVKRNWQQQGDLLGYIWGLGLVLTWIAVKAYKKLVKNYYDKACAVEKSDRGKAPDKKEQVLSSGQDTMTY